MAFFAPESVATFSGIRSYLLAALLLLSVGVYAGILLVFPLWVFLVSVFILIDNWRQPATATATDQM